MSAKEAGTHRQALASLVATFISHMHGGSKMESPPQTELVSWIQHMVGSKVGTELAYRWHQINSFQTVAKLEDADFPGGSTEKIRTLARRFLAQLMRCARGVFLLLRVDIHRLHGPPVPLHAGTLLVALGNNTFAGEVRRVLTRVPLASAIPLAVSAWGLTHYLSVGTDTRSLQDAKDMLAVLRGDGLSPEQDVHIVLREFFQQGSIPTPAQGDAVSDVTHTHSLIPPSTSTLGLGHSGRLYEAHAKHGM